jgi:hypothetical protein
MFGFLIPFANVLQHAVSTSHSKWVCLRPACSRATSYRSSLTATFPRTWSHHKKIRLRSSKIKPPKTTNPRTPIGTNCQPLLSSICPLFYQPHPQPSHSWSLFPVPSCRYPSRPENTSPSASLPSARFKSVQVKYRKGRSVLTQPKRTNRALKLLFLLDFASWLAPFRIERLLELRVGFALLGGLCLF